MLESASGSLPSYPGHPPAANEGLMSLVPDFILGPRKALDFGELQQAGRRERTRSFGMRSKACIDLAASAIKPCRRRLNWTSSGPAPCHVQRKSFKEHSQAAMHTVCLAQLSRARGDEIKIDTPPSLDTSSHY